MSMMDAMLNEYQLRMVKGEAAGHPFEGNQYTGGGGGGKPSADALGTSAAPASWNDRGNTFTGGNAQLQDREWASRVAQSKQVDAAVAAAKNEGISAKPAPDGDGAVAIDARDALVAMAGYDSRPTGISDAEASNQAIEAFSDSGVTVIRGDSGTVIIDAGALLSGLGVEYHDDSQPAAEAPAFAWNDSTVVNPPPGGGDTPGSTRSLARVKKGTVMGDKPDLEYLERVSQGNSPMATWARDELLKLRSPMLTKGDVEGHEFHGNQWTGGEGGATTPQNDGRNTPGSTVSRIDHPAGEESWMTEADHQEISARAAKGDWERSAIVPSQVEVHNYANGVSIKSKVSTNMTSTERITAEDARAIGPRLQAISYEPIVRVEFHAPNSNMTSVQNFSGQQAEALGYILSRISAPTAKLQSPMITKGDVEGHEFHGNQWTGGRGR